LLSKSVPRHRAVLLPPLKLASPILSAEHGSSGIPLVFLSAAENPQAFMNSSVNVINPAGQETGREEFEGMFLHLIANL
jgi:hypothetical protein